MGVRKEKKLSSKLFGENSSEFESLKNSFFVVVKVVNFDRHRIFIHLFDCHDGKISDFSLYWEILKRTIGEEGKALLVSHGQSMN